MSFLPPLTAPPLERDVRHYALFHADTGVFADRIVACEEGLAESMVGPRYVCIADVHAPRSKRIVDGQLVEDRGTQPSADHEWNGVLCEWRIKEAVLVARKAVADAKAAILDLEASQPRILRERELGDMTVVEARQRLRDIDDQIKALRAIINS